MTERFDPVQAAGLVTRQVRTGTHDGEPTRVVVARRRYSAERPDVWDAVTNIERIPRWFLPVTGDLSVGGRYQLEGNAGGVVESCDAPENFAVTWEFAGQISWLRVDLAEDGDGTVLELAHEAPVAPEFWEQYGPGATGVGWDLGLNGLTEHLATGKTLDSTEAEEWATSPEGVAFARASAEGWRDAAIDDGDDPEQAAAAAERTITFYTVPPES